MPFDLSDALPGDDLAEVSACVSSMRAARAEIAAAQVAEVKALERAYAVAERQIARLVTQTAKDAEMAMRSVSAELAAAAHVSDLSMQRQMERAATLIRRFPSTVDAWEAGRISRTHVDAILRAGSALSEHDALTAFEAAVVPRAEELAPGRLESYAGRVAEDLNPQSLTERHAKARAKRGVFVTDVGDGMSDLVATVPSALAHGAFDRLTQLTHALRDARPADDTRTTDEIRADIFCDLLLASTPGGDIPTGLAAITAVLQVSVPATTLAGTTDGGADISGATPIDAETARELAAVAPGWDRVFRHPVTGCVLTVDRYRPSEQQRRFLRARDEHCRFPGCRKPAVRCEIDHTEAAAEGGETCNRNLAHLCPRHHTMKHATPWKVRQRAGGILEWTSPAGLIYTDRPPALVRFQPSGDPPPF